MTSDTVAAIACLAGGMLATLVSTPMAPRLGIVLLLLSALIAGRGVKNKQAGIDMVGIVVMLVSLILAVCFWAGL